MEGALHGLLVDIGKTYCANLEKLSGKLPLVSRETSEDVKNPFADIAG